MPTREKDTLLEDLPVGGEPVVLYLRGGQVLRGVVVALTETLVVLGEDSTIPITFETRIRRKAVDAWR